MLIGSHSFLPSELIRWRALSAGTPCEVPLGSVTKAMRLPSEAQVPCCPSANLRAFAPVASANQSSCLSLTSNLPSLLLSRTRVKSSNLPSGDQTGSISLVAAGCFSKRRLFLSCKSKILITEISPLVAATSPVTGENVTLSKPPSLTLPNNFLLLLVVSIANRLPPSA